MSKPRSASVLIKIAFVLLVTFGGLVLLNRLASRADRPATAPATIQQTFADDPYCIYRLKPSFEIDLPMGIYGPYSDLWKRSGMTYHVSINSRGTRGPEFDAVKKPGARRVVLMGDSITFGWDVDYAESYAHLLGVFLSRAMGEGAVQVVNAGIPGYTSHQGVLQFRQWIRDLNPDVLVFAFSHNDEIDVRFNASAEAKTLSDAEMMPRDMGPYAFRQALLDARPGLVQRLRSTALYEWIRGQVAGAVGSDNPMPAAEPDPEAVKRRVSAKEFGNNLLEMGELTRERGMDLVFLLIGSKREEYGRAADEAAEHLGVPVIDMQPVFEARINEIRTAPRFDSLRRRYIVALGEKPFEEAPGGWLYYSTDETHPNAIGHAIIAEHLAQTLLDVGMLSN